MENREAVKSKIIEKLASLDKEAVTSKRLFGLIPIGNRVGGSRVARFTKTPKPKRKPLPAQPTQVSGDKYYRLAEKARSWEKDKVKDFFKG